MKKNNKVSNSLLVTLLIPIVISSAGTNLNAWSLFKKKEVNKPKKEIVKPKDDTNKVTKIIKKHYGKAIAATIIASGTAALACGPSRQFLIDQLLKLDEKISKNDESLNDSIVKKIEKQESELIRQAYSVGFITNKKDRTGNLSKQITNKLPVPFASKAIVKFENLKIQSENNKELIDAINVIYNNYDRLDSAVSKAAIDIVEASGFIKLEDIFLVRAEENKN